MTAPAEMPAVEEIARLERALRHAAATASNDDYTKAGTVERTRHVDRVTAILEAADALRAFTPILAEKERWKRQSDDWQSRGWELGKQVDALESRALAAETALAAERERAARIAEGTKSYDDNLQRSAGCATTGQRIAAAIRAA